MNSQLDYIRGVLRVAIDQAREEHNPVAAFDYFFLSENVNWKNVLDPVLRFAELQYRSACQLVNNYMILVSAEKFSRARASSSVGQIRSQVDLTAQGEFEDSATTALAALVEYVGDPRIETAVRLMSAIDNYGMKSIAFVKDERDWTFLQHGAEWMAAFLNANSTDPQGGSQGEST